MCMKGESVKAEIVCHILAVCKTIRLSTINKSNYIVGRVVANLQNKLDASLR